MILAQITTESLVGPGVQVTAAAVYFFFAKWLMAIHREDMRNLMDKMNSFHRALFLNTQATMLLGIAMDEAGTSVKTKLTTCLKELEESEAERLKAINERKTG